MVSARGAPVVSSGGMEVGSLHEEANSAEESREKPSIEAVAEGEGLKLGGRRSCY